MARSVLVTCDIGGETDARTYTVTYDSVKYEVDLCPTHAAPLIEIAEHGTKSNGAVTGPGPRGTKDLDRRIRGVPNADPKD